MPGSLRMSSTCFATSPLSAPTALRLAEPGADVTPGDAFGDLRLVGAGRRDRALVDGLVVQRAALTTRRVLAGVLVDVFLPGHRRTGVSPRAPSLGFDRTHAARAWRGAPGPFRRPGGTPLGERAGPHDALGGRDVEARVVGLDEAWAWRIRARTRAGSSPPTIAMRLFERMLLTCHAGRSASTAAFQNVIGLSYHFRMNCSRRPPLP